MPIPESREAVLLDRLSRAVGSSTVNLAEWYRSLPAAPLRGDPSGLCQLFGSQFQSRNIDIPGT